MQISASKYYQHMHVLSKMKIQNLLTAQICFSTS